MAHRATPGPERSADARGPVETHPREQTAFGTSRDRFTYRPSASVHEACLRLAGAVQGDLRPIPTFPGGIRPRFPMTLDSFLADSGHFPGEPVIRPAKPTRVPNT
jgi:hypothetical protein